MMRFVSFCLALTALSVPISMSAQAGMIDLQKIEIQVLDKSTARTTTLKANVGETIKYQSLFIKVQACRKSEPLDKPEDAAFLQIWEIPIGKKKSEWAFSGWMFSSSPALSAMDHAMYDVWVLECSSDAKAPVKQPKETLDQQSDSEAVSEESMDSEAEESDDSQEVEAQITRTPAKSFDDVIDNSIE